MTKKLTKIFFQWLIGWILCRIAWIYLLSHPAEKVWLESSVVWLVTKAQVWFYQMTNWKNESSQIYQKVIVWYEDLISDAEKCKIEVEWLKQKYEILKSWWVGSFVGKTQEFLDSYQLYRSMIQDQCK